MGGGKSVLKASIASLCALTLGGCFLFNSPEEGANFAPTDQTSQCPDQGAALQVLGSGGPIAETDRAGTSYLLWIDGEPRLLVDAGSGSFLRWAQAGGNIASLDAIVLTHLHADHVGDLVDILNSGGFEGRSAPLLIVGPDGAPRFPATSEFARRLISKEVGAFSYNGGYLDASENKPQLVLRDVPTAQGEGAPVTLEDISDYAVEAIPVNHADAPALGYAITVGDAKIVITGDQNAFSEAFQSYLASSNPDILFAHHVINGGPGQPRGLHRTPAQIGELAQALAARQLVLTHNMDRSLSMIDESRAAIANSYRGPVSVAVDLDCYTL